MKKTVGKVIEVFIPEQYKNGNLLDIINRTNIGYKIKTNEGIKEIIVEADEFNAKIMKDDDIIITEQTISGKYFIDIELYEGEDYV